MQSRLSKYLIQKEAEFMALPIDSFKISLAYGALLRLKESIDLLEPSTTQEKPNDTTTTITNRT